MSIHKCSPLNSMEFNVSNCLCIKISALQLHKTRKKLKHVNPLKAPCISDFLWAQSTFILALSHKIFFSLDLCKYHFFISRSRRSRSQSGSPPYGRLPSVALPPIERPKTMGSVTQLSARGVRFLDKTLCQCLPLIGQLLPI